MIWLMIVGMTSVMTACGTGIFSKRAVLSVFISILSLFMRNEIRFYGTPFKSIYFIIIDLEYVFVKNIKI